MPIILIVKRYKPINKIITPPIRRIIYNPLLFGSGTNQPIRSSRAELIVTKDPFLIKKKSKVSSLFLTKNPS